MYKSNMGRAVDDFERSVKDIDSKLDMLEWKVRTLSDGDQILGNNESLDETNKPLLDLLDAVPRVTKEYEDTMQKLLETEEDIQQTSDRLTNKLDSLNVKIKRLREKVGDGTD